MHMQRGVVVIPSCEDCVHDFIIYKHMYVSLTRAEVALQGKAICSSGRIHKGQHALLEKAYQASGGILEHTQWL